MPLGWLQLQCLSSQVTAMPLGRFTSQTFGSCLHLFDFIYLIFSQVPHSWLVSRIDLAQRSPHMVRKSLGNDIKLLGN
jgi:hypothetical protein